MRFEICDDDPTTADAVFSKGEREILNSALLKSLINAAIHGGVQLYDDGQGLLSIARPLLEPKFFASVKVNALNASHLHELSESVTEYQREVPHEKVKEVAELATELLAAHHAVAGTYDPDLSESIEATIANTQIPNSPAGLAD